MDPCFVSICVVVLVFVVSYSVAVSGWVSVVVVWEGKDSAMLLFVSNALVFAVVGFVGLEDILRFVSGTWVAIAAVLIEMGLVKSGA